MKQYILKKSKFYFSEFAEVYPLALFRFNMPWKEKRRIFTNMLERRKIFRSKYRIIVKENNSVVMIWKKNHPFIRRWLYLLGLKNGFMPIGWGR